MKKLLILLLKIAISVAIIAFLVWRATKTQKDGENVFENLVNQPKQWGLLAAAWACCATAIMITFFRWWYLVLALKLPLPLKGALRISFLGYLFNLAPMGIVGGDLLKAFMLGHEYRNHRAKAFASVAVDRVIGLYMLFVVASAGVLVTGLWRFPETYIRVICYATFALTAIGGIGIAMLLTPGVTEGRLSRALGRIPRVGATIGSLIEAIRMYRRQPKVLINSALMSVVVHSLFATGIYLIARGLPGAYLSLKEHFAVSPISAVTGVFPLPIGPFECFLDFLYTRVDDKIAPGQGLVVALSYRLICISVAMIGVCYYLGSRREVAEVMHEAEQEKQADGPA